MGHRDRGREVIGDGEQAGTAEEKVFVVSWKYLGYTIHNGNILKDIQCINNMINWDLKTLVLAIELYVVHETGFGETRHESIARVRSERSKPWPYPKGVGDSQSI